MLHLHANVHLYYHVNVHARNTIPRNMTNNKNKSTWSARPVPDFWASNSVSASPKNRKMLGVSGLHVFQFANLPSTMTADSVCVEHFFLCAHRARYSSTYGVLDKSIHTLGTVCMRLENIFVLFRFECAHVPWQRCIIETHKRQRIADGIKGKNQKIGHSCRVVKHKRCYGDDDDRDVHKERRRKKKEKTLSRKLNASTSIV